MRISIAGKICFVLLMIFSCVLLGVTTYQAHLEHQMLWLQSKSEARQHMYELLAQQNQTRSLHHASPGISSRDIPLQESPRISGQISFHSPTTFSLSLQDKLDLDAWRGKTGDSEVKQGNETLLMVVSPLYLDLASNDYRLAPADENDKPVGIVRISYSLTHALSQIEQHLLITALLLCLFFGAGVLLALYIVRNQIVAPLHRISQAMERAADLGDYSPRMQIERNDELGQLSHNFNQLMLSLATQAQDPSVAEVTRPSSHH